MTLHRHKLSFAGAALALLLGASAASAATAFASTTVNVRSGPGTDYRVVDSLRRGERVDVQRCIGSWCLVEKAGPDGWVNANYLDASPRRYRDDFYDDDFFDDGFYVRPRPRLHVRPYYRSQVCWGGPNASVCFRD